MTFRCSIVILKICVLKEKENKYLKKPGSVENFELVTSAVRVDVGFITFYYFTKLSKYILKLNVVLNLRKRLLCIKWRSGNKNFHLSARVNIITVVFNFYK